MKKLLNYTAAFAAAILAAASCQKEMELAPEVTAPEEPAVKEYTLNVNASKGEDTKALSLDEKTLNVKWADTDQVSVFAENWGDTPLGTLTAAASETASTTLTGSVTGAAINDKLNLLFPRAEWNYTGQKGILLGDENSIEKKYDYATAQVTVSDVEGTTITTDPATLESQQAIVKFYLKNKATSAPLNVTTLKLSANGGKLVQSREMISPTPEGYEPVTGPDNYLYIEFSEKPGHMMYIKGNDYAYFNNDSDFGTDGCKVVGGKYLCRFKTSDAVSQVLNIEIESDSGPDYLVNFNAEYGSDSPIDFTNGMYLRQNSSQKVDVVDLAGEPVLTSVYGSLTITPDAATDELTVALRNELGAADTYEIWASDGVNGYMLTSPSVEFVDGQYYEIGLRMVQEPAYYAATSGDIGKVIGVDGNIYDNVAAANASSTAVAMIAYVGNASNCAHGLAIALDDVSASKLHWADAITASAAQTPAVFGGTWRLPSILDWQYMFVGCGDTGTPKATSVSVTRATKLMEKLTSSGATIMKNTNQTSGYWTATEYGTDWAWSLNFWDWVSSDGYWYVGSDRDNWRDSFTHSVRACLAF